jgi:hypothetical protein
MTENKLLMQLQADLCGIPVGEYHNFKFMNCYIFGNMLLMLHPHTEIISARYMSIKTVCRMGFCKCMLSDLDVTYYHCLEPTEH